MQKIMPSAKRTPAYIALHPLIICAFTAVALAYFSEEGFLSMIRWVAIAIAIFVMPIYFIFQQFRRRWESERVVQATAISGVVLVGVLLALAYAFTAPESFVFYIYIGLVNGVAVLLANRFLAISPYAVILSGCAITVLLMSPLAALFVYPLCVASAWLIYKSERSSLQEITQTWAAVSLCSILVFNLFYMS